MDRTIPWLLVLLREPLTLAWLDDDIGPGFTLGSDLFEAVADTDLSGFYDRLYDADESFVGLQITPIPELELTNAIVGLKYAQAIDGNNHLRLFFFGAPLRDPREVGDQSFGGRIYRSLSGELAFSLDTFFLEEEERTGVTNAKAQWVKVTPLGT